MKTFHKLIAVGTAMACVGLASATPTTIRITGSTAFRKAVQIAIMHVLGSTDGTTLPNDGFSKYGYFGSLTGGDTATFYGTVNGNQVIIKTSWTGSVGGVQTVAGSLTSVKWLPSSVDASFTNTGFSVAADPQKSTTATDYETGAGTTPDISMSDSFQSSTVFKGGSYATLTDTIVGVVPFKWVVNATGAGKVTNITPQLAQATWLGAGRCPLALYTGLNADENTFVYATGRDPDSGTRLAAFAETGIGVNSGIKQYDIAHSGTTPTLYVANTINGIAIPQGQGGESSGGTLAGLMRTTISRIFVSYFSVNDAATATAAGTGQATEVPYNGFSYGDGTPVIEGKYTFWGYEHLMYRPGTSGVALSTANTLANQILTVDATQAGLKVGDMNVVRSTDGGRVTANY